MTVSTTTRPATGRAAPAGGGSAAPAPKAPLGSTAINRSAAPEAEREIVRRGRRDQAWRLRRSLWDLSTLDRVRACGRVAQAAGAGPTLRLSEDEHGRRAGLAGLQSCGSVWACPCCGPKIGRARADEIRSVVEAAHAEGCGAAMITLTSRHHAGQRLIDQWDATTYAWSAVCSGAAYSAECQRFGIEGWARAFEATHGDAGWHPHLHILVIFDTPLSAEMLDALAQRWWLRWERALRRKGFDAVAHRGGLDARLVALDSSDQLGVYLSKIACEVTGGQLKDGRFGNRSPFAILADGVATGLADDIERWWEWEQASHGRRQLTWSRSLRSRFKISQRTDEEIAEEDLGTDDLIALPAETWAAIRPEAEDLLSAAEIGGLSGAVRWLDSRGLRWSWATSAPPPSKRPPRRARAPRLPCATEAAIRRSGRPGHALR